MVSLSLRVALNLINTFKTLFWLFQSNETIPKFFTKSSYCYLQCKVFFISHEESWFDLKFSWRLFIYSSNHLIKICHTELPIHILVLFGLLFLNSKVSDAAAHLERTFMSPASIRAVTLIRGWMEDAGLSTLVLNLLSFVYGLISTKLSWIDEKIGFLQMGWLYGECTWSSRTKEWKLTGSSNWFPYGKSVCHFLVTCCVIWDDNTSNK